MWLEGLATNLSQKNFILSLFKVPHIKYVISNGKTSKFEIDFELKKIGRKFSGIIMLSRIPHMFNNSEGNYSVLWLFRLCILWPFYFDHLIRILGWAEEFKVYSFRKKNDYAPSLWAKRMSLLTFVSLGHRMTTACDQIIIQLSMNWPCTAKI